MSDEPRIEIAACPMPGCGERCFVASSTHWGVGGNKRVVCAKCTYSSRDFELSADAIAAHNALCADVRRGREAEKIERERDALEAEVERLRALANNAASIVRALLGTMSPSVQRKWPVIVGKASAFLLEVNDCAALDAGKGENG